MDPSMKPMGAAVLVVHHELQEPLGLRKTDRHVAAMLVSGGV
jgi:hypothetical protein